MRGLPGICDIAQMHNWPKWSESFYYNEGRWQKRSCTVCGHEEWRPITVSAPVGEGR
jgi:hypothetical protein